MGHKCAQSQRVKAVKARPRTCNGVTGSLPGKVADVKACLGALSTVRSLQHSLTIVFAGVAKTVISVQPFL